MRRKARRGWRLWAAALLLGGCAVSGETGSSLSPAAFGEGWVTTYAKYLPRAEAGDPRHQTLLGYMLFFGEGIPRDRILAHRWFHLAAEQGDAVAARNLAIMHRLGIGIERNVAEARAYAAVAGMTDLEAVYRSMPRALRDGRADWVAVAGAAAGPIDRGEETYARFCAGCHGLNGIAAFIESPSFALGERLEKSDGELLYSIRQGRGIMPGWGDKLPIEDLRAALDHIRRFPERYRAGIVSGLRRAPSYFFLFGPMQRDPSAFHGPYIDFTADLESAQLAALWTD